MDRSRVLRLQRGEHAFLTSTLLTELSLWHYDQVPTHYGGGTRKSRRLATSQQRPYESSVG
jgi:hypothetical protein